MNIGHNGKTRGAAAAFILVLLIPMGAEAGPGASGEPSMTANADQAGGHSAPSDARSRSSSGKMASADTASTRRQANLPRPASRSPAGGVAPASLGTLEVQAQKRAQPLGEVPESIGVVGGETLKRINAVSFADYLTRVPGVNFISPEQGLTQIVIRGITSGSNQGNSTVGTFINNVPFGSSTVYSIGDLLTPDLDPAEIQRVVVLKGPQGTLYGSNTLGGLVKFVTRPPDTLHYGARAKIGFKSTADGGTGYGVHAMGNAPLISNTLAIRAHVYRRHDPGYIDDIGKHESDVNDTRVDGGRAELFWTPSTSVSLRLSALAQNLTSDGLANGGVDVDAKTLEPIYGDLLQKHSPGTGQIDIKYRLYAANIDADLGWGSLVSTTSYGQLRFMNNQDVTNAYGPVLGPALGLPNPGFSFRHDVALNKLTQELRLQSPSMQKLEWRVGLFYTHEHSTNRQTVPAFNATTGAPIALPVLLADARVGPAKFTEEAVYGDITWHFTRRFDILLGGRYTHERTEYNQIADGLLFGGHIHFESSDAENPTTFLINPKYKFGRDSIIYARIASGFRPGGANVGVPPGLGAPTSFDPDKLTSYALGFKSAMLDRRLTLNLSAFYIDWKKIQLITFSGGFSFEANGGSVRSQGIEAALTWRPLDSLTLSASATYTDAELTRDTPPGLFGKDGQRLPYVPKWNATLGADYDFPLGGAWSGFVGAGYRFVGTRKADFNSVPGPRIEIPAYHVVDAHVGAQTGHWTIEAFVKNIGNERGITSVSPETSVPLASPYAAAYVRPRTIGLSAAYQF
jgi:outer membrane receptor protein involved in Fe transport